MTMCQFAKEYGVTRSYVNNAVALYGVRPVGMSKSKYRGRPAKDYDQRALAVAVAKYYRCLAEEHVIKARAWVAKANKLGNDYRRKQNDNAT